MATKSELAEWKKLASEHSGKAVVTAWSGASTWSYVGLEHGVSGRVCGWGIDGPRVEVDESDIERSALGKFFPGGSGENWGCGRTWKFKDETKEGKDA